MTQYWCGHLGHDGTRPNLTVQVCSALSAPPFLVGELDIDGVQTAAAPQPTRSNRLDSSRPSPEDAYTGTPAVQGGVEVPCVVTPATPHLWPATILDGLTLALGLAAVGFFISRFLQSFTQSSRFQAWWLWSVALILFAAVAVWARNRYVENRAETNNDWRVVVQCPTPIEGKFHSIVFAGPPPSGTEHVFGAVATKQDKAITAGQMKYGSPDDAVDRLNRQARSIFTGQALFVLFLGGVVWRVTTDDSGAAVGIDNIDGFVRNNGTEFSLAVAALAVSFAMALLAQTFGSAGGVNLRDQLATAREFNRVIRIRAGFVQNASVMLGVSLLLAVAVPIASALARTTGIEISSPTWTLTDGEWEGTVEATFQDLRDDERLELTAVRGNDDDKEPLARWVGVRPAATDTGDSLSVPLRFRATAESSSVMILARIVGDGESADAPSECPDANAPRLVACAEFAVPQPSAQPATVSAEPEP